MWAHAGDERAPVVGGHDMTAPVIVVPCFDEVARWDADYWRRLAVGGSARWVFVDDGSSDATRQLLERFCAATPTAVLVRLPRNRGKAEAVRHGLLQAIDMSGSGGVVGFVDADGAFSPSEVDRLLGRARDVFGDGSPVEAIWSSRVALAGRSIDRRLSRHYVGRVVATLISLGYEATIPYDTQCGFKLFRSSDTLSECLQRPFATRWFFEMELFCRWQTLTGTPPHIWEEPLLEWRDVAGSHISRTDVLRIARELLVVKREQRRAQRAAVRPPATGGAA